MNVFAHVLLSWLTGQEFSQEDFDKNFVEYFKHNPNGFDEVIKAVKEQVPEQLKQRFLDMFTRLNDIAKEAKNDSNVH